MLFVRQGLEGREAVAIVVDDTSTVWAQHAGNLLAVERYIFFPSSRRQFGLPGKSLLELNRSLPTRPGAPAAPFRSTNMAKPCFGLPARALLQQSCGDELRVMRREARLQ